MRSKIFGIVNLFIAERDSQRRDFFGLVSGLKFFSFLQNCQDPGLGSVEQSPKTCILISTGNGSSPIFTKLGVDIPHGASTNP